MHLALVVRAEARSTADITGSRAISPTSRLTLAATDVCEDPAQYGRFSAPCTSIQQITNGVHIEGGSGRTGADQHGLPRAGTG
jgi:hypothetical protein